MQRKFLIIRHHVGANSVKMVMYHNPPIGLRPHGDGLLVAGLFFTDYPPSWEKNPTGVAQLVARSTPDRCFASRGTEHFGFPPSAPRLGNQRPWYVQPHLCDWTYKRSRATYRKEKGIVSRWSVSSYSFIHKVIIITGLNKFTICSRSVDGLRCRQGVKPPLKLKKLTLLY